MRKTLLLPLAVLLAMAIAAPPASAITLVPGYLEAHIKDAGTLYAPGADQTGGATGGSDGWPDVWYPRPPRRLSVAEGGVAPDTFLDFQTSSVLGEAAANAALGGADDPVVGDELRSVYYVDTLHGPEPWGGGTQYEQFGIPYGEELTGLLYDLKLVEVNPLSATFVELYFAPLGRNPITSDWDNDMPAGSGGVFELYRDAAPDGTPLTWDPDGAGGLLGPQQWVEGDMDGSGPHIADTLESGAVGATDGTLWMQGVLTPLGLTPGGLSYVLKETFDLTAANETGDVLPAYVNITGGSPEVLSLFERGVFDVPPAFVGRDVKIDANFVFPFATDYASSEQSTAGWQIASSDPTRAYILPEPGTVSLLGLSLLGLALRRRRRKD